MDILLNYGNPDLKNMSFILKPYYVELGCLCCKFVYETQYFFFTLQHSTFTVLIDKNEMAVFNPSYPQGIRFGGSKGRMRAHSQVANVARSCK